jgi:ADP-ribose pyrophosphatase
MDIVRHRGSVVLIPRPDARHVILIRQYRHVIGQTIWELPAGSLEVGEAPLAPRGASASRKPAGGPGRVERIGMYFPYAGFCDERMIFYECSRL